MYRKINFSNLRIRLIILLLLMLGLLASMLLIYFQNKQINPQVNKDTKPATKILKSPVEPTVETQTLVDGLANPWEVIFLPDNSILYAERSGKISRLNKGVKSLIVQINDVYAVGEGGLTGMALDSNFVANNFIYTCHNARTAGGIDVRVVRWSFNVKDDTLNDRKDIITGIPSNRSGRHSGCRIATDKQGNLWVGTGDAALATTPQDPTSLGGKILHVTRDGMPAGNNMPAPFDPRIFSYGHRNTQGFAIFNKPIKGVFGYSVEHGSNIEDEVNLLKNGNFGWAPKTTYVENGIPMTDLGRFPEAVSAVWNSGNVTIAPSGATLLNGENWGTWNGALAVAVLKGKQIKIIKFDNEYKIVSEKSILTDFGRLRSAKQGPDGNLYITTDNTVNDKIIKVTPSQN